MKHFLLAFMISLPALADQGSSMGTLRDKKLIELMEKVNKYCEESYPELLKQKDSAFLCYLQLEADSKHADKSLRDFAVSIRNEARYLETAVIGLQANTAQISKTHIGSEIERIKDPCKFNPSLAECNIEYFAAGGKLAGSAKPKAGRKDCFIKDPKMSFEEACP